MKGHTPEAIGATMTSEEIAELVGSRHDNVKRTIDTLAAKEVIQFPQSEERERINGLGLKQSSTVYVFTGERGKRDSIIVVAQLCPEFTARLVDRWQELEQRLQLAAAADLSDRVNASLLLVESMRRTLNLSNSSAIGAYRKIEQHYGLPPMTPTYAIDAPSDAVDGSSRTTAALRTLLQRRGFPLKVQDAYRRLETAGIVVRMSRPSTKGPNKEFWSVTTKGLLFGKNMTSPGNPRETQSHFFESRADELLAMIAG